MYRGFTYLRVLAGIVFEYFSRAAAERFDRAGLGQVAILNYSVPNPNSKHHTLPQHWLSLCILFIVRFFSKSDGGCSLNCSYSTIFYIKTIAFLNSLLFRLRYFGLCYSESLVPKFYFKEILLKWFYFFSPKPKQMKIVILNKIIQHFLIFQNQMA